MTDRPAIEDAGATGGGAADAFAELERLVRALGDELAFFRRRALEAERRVRDLTAAVAPPPSVLDPAGESAAGPDPEQAAERIGALEAENARLRDEKADLEARLADAAARTRAMADRLRFLRQQEEVGGER